MIFNIPDTIEDIYTVGDVHGNWNIVTFYIRQYKIKNSVFIFCGDIGIGFQKLNYYNDCIIPELHKTLSKFNDIFIWIRGNHSDPSYFNNQLINTEYIKCVPDYSIINTCNKNILCVGGGISIDRIQRKHQDSIRLINYMKQYNCSYKIAEQECPLLYWEDEQVIYKPKVKEHIDIICSHSAPSFCYPFNKGELINEYAQYDNKLLNDIKTERSILDAIYNDYNSEITHWYYGHFHKSYLEYINNICFKLLNIGEICKHNTRTDTNYIL